MWKYCQWGVISYQLSVISYQLSVIRTVRMGALVSIGILSIDSPLHRLWRSFPRWGTQDVSAGKIYFRKCSSSSSVEENGDQDLGIGGGAAQIHGRRNFFILPSVHFRHVPLKHLSVRSAATFPSREGGDRYHPNGLSSSIPGSGSAGFPIACPFKPFVPTKPPGQGEVRQGVVLSYMSKVS